MVDETWITEQVNRGVPKEFARWAFNQIDDSDMDCRAFDLVSQYDHGIEIFENKRLFRNRFITNSHAPPSQKDQQAVMEKESRDAYENWAEDHRAEVLNELQSLYCCMRVNIMNAEQNKNPLRVLGRQAGFPDGHFDRAKEPVDGVLEVLSIQEDMDNDPLLGIGMMVW